MIESLSGQLQEIKSALSGEDGMAGNDGMDAEAAPDISAPETDEPVDSEVDDMQPKKRMGKMPDIVKRMSGGY